MGEAYRVSSVVPLVPGPEDEPDPFASWPDGRIWGCFDCTPDPRRWFATDRLIAGRAHVLAGVGGSSKTRAMYAMAVAAVIGRLPWSWHIESTGSAALFLAEDTVHDMHSALHAIGSTCTEDERKALNAGLRVFSLAGKALRLLELRSGNTLAEGLAYHWLRARINLMPKPVTFIGIDPALAVTEGDELSPAHQRRLGELVDRIAIETGACLVLTTHARKSLGKDEELGSHSSRGSGAITDAARGEIVLRSMTADEARSFGIDDRVERARYVQLAITKGNSLPPEAFAPVWLRRGAEGMLSEVTLGQVERGSVGRRELQALDIMKQHAPHGDLTTRFWQGQCELAGLVSGSSDAAKEKSMQRIRGALVDAGLVIQGRRTGLWVPA
jgi:hypothetical protein